MVQRSRKPVTPQRKPIRPIERQKMRPWLLNLLKTEYLEGFSWVSKDEKTFRISWRHAARQGWDPDIDADLFERWARHTGKHLDGDEPDPKRWKANFRCALNSLPDVKELKDEGVRKGKDAYKVYKFMSEKKTRITKSQSEDKVTQTKTKRSLRIRNARISYARMEVDSEGEEEICSDCGSPDNKSDSHRDETPDESSRSSDCGSIAESPEIHTYADCPDLPVFDKICKSIDLNTLAPFLPKKLNVSQNQLQQESLKEIQRDPLSFDDESESTTSTLTDEDLVQMLLDVENHPEQTENLLYITSPSGPNVLDCENIPTCCETVIDGENSYFVLNVANEIIIQDTPAVRTEQIGTDIEMQLTGLQQL